MDTTTIRMGYVYDMICAEGNAVFWHTTMHPTEISDDWVKLIDIRILEDANFGVKRNPKITLARDEIEVLTFTEIGKIEDLPEYFL